MKRISLFLAIIIVIVMANMPVYADQEESIEYQVSPISIKNSVNNSSVYPQSEINKMIDGDTNTGFSLFQENQTFIVQFDSQYKFSKFLLFVDETYKPSLLKTDYYDADGNKTFFHYVSNPQLSSDTIPFMNLSAYSGKYSSKMVMKIGDFYFDRCIINEMVFYTEDKPLEYFIVTYYNDNGENIPEKEGVSKNGNYHISNKIPTKYGYDFLGWSTHNDSKEPEYLVDGIIENVQQNITLYPVWKSWINDSCDGGYYTESDSNPMSNITDGILSFTADFADYKQYGFDIEKYGFFVYNQANKSKEATIESDSLNNINKSTGKFTTYLSVPENHLSTYVVAKPFVVIAGNTIWGDAMTTSVAKLDKWLGKNYSRRN